jgi:hypothetical protein
MSMRRSCTTAETAENRPSGARCRCRRADAADEDGQAHGVGHFGLQRDGRRPRQVPLDLLPPPRGLRLSLHCRRGQYERGGGRRIVHAARRARSRSPSTISLHQAAFASASTAAAAGTGEVAADTSSMPLAALDSGRVTSLPWGTNPSVDPCCAVAARHELAAAAPPAAAPSPPVLRGVEVACMKK